MLDKETKRARSSVVWEPGLTVADIAYLLKTAKMVGKIVSTPSQTIIKEQADDAAEIFSRNKSSGIPVIIAAWNEQEDLPRLLYALSLSEGPVKPLVIDNGSDDNTRKIAERFGVTVLEEERGGIIYARRKGYLHLKKESGNPYIVLCLDADSIPGQNWSQTMTEMLNNYPPEGGEAFGFFAYYGGTFLSDLLLDIIDHRPNFSYPIYKNTVRTHGGNSGIKFDREGRIIDALTRLNPKFVTGTSTYILDAVLDNGGYARRNLNPRSVAFTRSDRFPNLVSVLAFAFKMNRLKMYSDYFGRNPRVDYFNGSRYEEKNK